MPVARHDLGCIRSQGTLDDSIVVGIRHYDLNICLGFDNQCMLEETFKE